MIFFAKYKLRIPSRHKMTAKKNSASLIVHGVDVTLPDKSLTFTPASLDESNLSYLSVTAQGADIASCQSAVDS